MRVPLPPAPIGGRALPGCRAFIAGADGADLPPAQEPPPPRRAISPARERIPRSRRAFPAWTRRSAAHHGARHDGGTEELGGGEKTARPANVGPHDRGDDQHDPADPGTKPEEYEPKPGDNNNRTDAAAPGGPVNIGVKGGADEAGPDAAKQEVPQATGRGSRDLSSLPQE